MAEVCRAFRNTGRCRYGDGCSFEHSEGPEIAQPPRGQCHNWEQTGACEYGDRCRFLHGADDDGSRFEKKPKAPRAPREAGEDKPKKSRVRKSRPPKKIDEVCNNYLEGRCRNGDECRRTHEPEGIAQNIEKLDEVCNNFLEGRCRFGELCRRKH